VEENVSLTTSSYTSCFSFLVYCACKDRANWHCEHCGVTRTDTPKQDAHRRSIEKRLHTPEKGMVTSQEPADDIGAGS
jgi:hypothetical protein